MSKPEVPLIVFTIAIELCEGDNSSCIGEAVAHAVSEIAGPLQWQVSLTSVNPIGRPPVIPELTVAGMDIPNRWRAE